MQVFRKPERATLPHNWQTTIDDHVIALAWSPDGYTLAVAAISGPITLFDAASGALKVQLPGHGFGTTAIAWSPDGSQFASCGQDGTIKLWDVAQGQERLALKGGAGWVERLAWSNDSQLLASAAGRILRVWNTNGDMVREYPPHPSTIADIQWMPGTGRVRAKETLPPVQASTARPKGRAVPSADTSVVGNHGTSILTSAAYGSIALWQPDSVEPLGRYEWKGSILAIAWSPDGRFIATGDQDATVHFWFARDGSDLQMWGYETKVRELAWDHTSRYLATGGGPAAVVWDCSGKGPEGTKPLMYDEHDGFISALAFQRRGPLLAEAGADGRIGVWQPGRGRKALGGATLPSGVTQLAWHPDDQAFAAGAEDGTVVVYRVKS